MTTDCTASVSGNWSNTATWGGSAVPTDGQSVAIAAGITVLFDVDQSGFATGINGISGGTGSVLMFAYNATPTTGNGAVWLQMKTGTTISGTQTNVRIGGGGPTTSPVEDACQVKYGTWPSSGVAVTNSGLAGSSYNATLAVNEYRAYQSGSTAQTQANSTDTIDVPKGAAVNNLTTHTLEFFFYISSTASTTYLMAKNTYYVISISSTGQLVITRYDTGGSAYKTWTSPSNTFYSGGFYAVQISWDCSTVTNTPVAKVNNLLVTLTPTTSGTTTAWKDDSGSDMYIFSRSAATSPIIGMAFLFRLHSRCLTDAEMTTNYNADRNRYEGPMIQRPAAVTEALSSNANSGQTTVTVGAGNTSQFIAASSPSLITGTSAASGQKVVNVTNGALFTAGQIVTIGDSSQNETNVIASINSNALTMQMNLLYTYTSAHGGYVCIGSSGVIYLVNGAESGSPSTSLRETAVIASINAGAGTLTVNSNLQNSYTTSAGAYVVQQQIPQAVMNWHGASSTSGYIGATGPSHSIQGWYPTTGSANSNAYVMINAAAVSGQGYIDIVSDMGFQAGDQILIGSGSTSLDGNNCLYTVTKYEATGGTGGVPRVHIFPNLATTNRAGGNANPESNDYVAWYSRPIVLSRTIYATVSHYNSVGFLPAGAQLTGYRTFRTYGVSIPSSCFNNTIDGTTGDGNTSGGYNAAAYGCTCKNSVSYNAANVLTGQTNYNSGNIGYYANVHSDSGSLCVNCVITNSGTSRAILSTAVGSQMVNPIGRYGPIYYSIGGGSTIIVGARTAGTYNDIYLGAAGSSNVYCYNCVLGQSTPCTGYNSGWRPAQAAVQSYNQSGTAGSYYLWCRGGIATTNQSTQVYGTDTYGTMKFTIDGTINNSPIVWDTWFYMPGTNRSLTFNVPMYAASTDGITAAVWIVDPTNDPLVYRTFPVTAATWVPSTPTVGTAIGNVLAIAYPTFTASPGWQNVNITVPAQASPGKELICRVIFTGSIPGKIGYAYISNMEKMLMITRQRFA